MNSSPGHPFRAMTVFIVLIGIQLAIWIGITTLSSQFHFDSAGETRPLLLVLGLFAAASVTYLASIPLALKIATSRRSIAGLFLIAIVFRAVVLVSEPIQEVDIYRYIWDGAVLDEGVNPYQYSPANVRNTIEASSLFADDGPPDDSPPDDSPSNGSPSEGNSAEELAKLAAMAKAQPGLREVLRRVHFGELPTVYPPVSQYVFRFAHRLTPEDANAVLHTRVMKSIIVLFDLGVMGVLCLLLIELGKNPAWCVAYGWSPLVVKEFANSGHLDSIAVFFVILAVWCAVRACSSKHSSVLVLASAVSLGLGVGSKLYPIVLFPLLAAFVWRNFGHKGTIAWTCGVCIGCASLAPMLLQQSNGVNPDQLTGIKTFFDTGRSTT